MKKIGSYIILILFTILILIINTLKVFKYSKNHITYSDGDNLNINKFKVILHTITMTYAMIALLISFKYKLPHSKKIIFYIFLFNYIFLLGKNSFKLKDFKPSLSFFSLVISPLPFIYLAYNFDKIKYAEYFVFGYFAFINCITLNADFNNYIINPIKNIKNSKCPFSKNFTTSRLPLLPGLILWCFIVILLIIDSRNLK